MFTRYYKILTIASLVYRNQPEQKKINEKEPEMKSFSTKNPEQIL